VGDVLFVRELAADRDLVLAFAADGSPAWALDLESGLQWWYPGGDRVLVRDAIAEHWSTFATMPITAASYAGPHPALELGRRADAAARVEPPSTPEPPWTAQLTALLRELSIPARVAVAVGALLLAVTVVPWVGSFLVAGTSASHGVDDATVPVVATAGERCDVRGEISHDTQGRVLVCVAPSRALSSQLEWRSTT
jgi:hypothetical protein